MPRWPLEEVPGGHRALGAGRQADLADPLLEAAGGQVLLGHLAHRERLGPGEVHPLAPMAVADAGDEEPRELVGVEALHAHIARQRHGPSLHGDVDVSGRAHQVAGLEPASRSSTTFRPR